jgi:hypothetical protein
VSELIEARLNRVKSIGGLIGSRGFLLGILRNIALYLEELFLEGALGGNSEGEA